MCPMDQADEICRRIEAAAWTGRKGDGGVYTMPVNTFARIREAGAKEHRND
ncbi:hypothetical protein ABTD98_21070 [Acinetobacter baumannii]